MLHLHVVQICIASIREYIISLSESDTDTNGNGEDAFMHESSDPNNEGAQLNAVDVNSDVFTTSVATTPETVNHATVSSNFDPEKLFEGNNEGDLILLDGTSTTTVSSSVQTPAANATGEVELSNNIAQGNTSTEQDNATLVVDSEATGLKLNTTAEIDLSSNISRLNISTEQVNATSVVSDGVVDSTTTPFTIESKRQRISRIHC